MFLWNFSEIVKKIWRNVWNTCTNFLIFWLKFYDILLSIFGKTYEKLLEKHEKYFMVSVPFKNAVIILIMTALNISPLQISWCFNFYKAVYTYTEWTFVSKFGVFAKWVC